MTQPNFYIKFHKPLIENAKTERELTAQKERSNNRAADLCLNRGFNESIDEFKKRRPDFFEFLDWNREVGQKITLK